MHTNVRGLTKSVQDFLHMAQPGTYFETTFGRFVFLKRISFGEYSVAQKIDFNTWKKIPVFKILGELQPGKQKRVNLNTIRF